ncbi:MAG: hypothetical protein F4Z31_01735 [Gemmatimonadetes bacterium]|nr:hypothetical protein [Gemmatimonadota bacterium]
MTSQQWQDDWQDALGHYGEVLERFAVALEGQIGTPEWDVREVMGSGHASGLRPLRALIMAGAVSIEDMAAAAALVAPARAPRPERETIRVDPSQIDMSLVAAISVSVCRRLRAVPLRVEDAVLVVAEGESSPLMQAELAELVSACPEATSARTMLSGDEEMAAALQFMEAAAADVGEADAEAADTGDEYPKLVDTTGANRVEGNALQKMLSMALAWKSADIHMSTALDPSDGKRYLTVRLERLGQLVVHERRLPGETGDRIMARIRAVSNMTHDTVRPQDASVSIVNPITKARIIIRISAVPLVDGNQMMTLRLLPLVRPDLSTLDTLFPPDVVQEPLEVLKAAVRRPDGLTLVTGRTGDGKTTTLAALINEISHESRKIVTAEEPVEYRIPGAEQVQINTAQGFGYPEAIRAFLRSAPDVIMIGEIRDEATATAAMRAAETGHLVMSTLHVKNAAAAMTRLRGVGVGIDEIASSLNLVVAQRLLRTLCGACDQSNPGCEKCYGTGWAGRAAVMEALLVDNDLVELLARPVPPTPAAIRECQLIKFADHARALVESGRTTEEEAVRVLGTAAGFDT